MSKRGSGYGSEHRVDILKKVKVGKTGTSSPPTFGSGEILQQGSK